MELGFRVGVEIGCAIPFLLLFLVILVSKRLSAENPQEARCRPSRRRSRWMDRLRQDSDKRRALAEATKIVRRR